MRFYESLEQALIDTRNTRLFVVDGPEENYAVMTPDEAADFFDDGEECRISHYGFYTLEQARAVDEYRLMQAFGAAASPITPSHAMDVDAATLQFSLTTPARLPQ